jgi:hypothetical protein
MSWALSDAGTPAEIKQSLEARVANLLGAGSKLDASEQETVQLVKALLLHEVEQFDADKRVFVAANGHADVMGGRSRQLNISIR